MFTAEQPWEFRMSLTSLVRTAAAAPAQGSTVLPGGIGISSLTVYGSGSVDGHMGGSAHMHLACSEAYYVVAGRGTAQTLNTAGFRETTLRPGVVMHFEPGTIHRLVNDGDLQILVMMQNGGLPEAGDAVLTLPPEHLSDRARYEAATALVEGDEHGCAMRRRDLSIMGFTALREAFQARGAEALEPFFASATELVRPLIGQWRRRWQDGARLLADTTGEQLDELDLSDHSHLRAAGVHIQPQPEVTGRLGMCGHLDVYAASV